MQKFLLTFSLILIGLCVIVNVATYLLTPSPVFNNLISARILGKNETDTFLEMVWELDSQSYFAYVADSTELYIVEGGYAIARLNTDNNIAVRPSEVTMVKMSVIMNNEWFERFAKDPNELYPFQVQGTVVAKVLFFYKVLPVNQTMPIKLKLLVNDFLTDSFKNAIMIENVRVTNNYVDCNLNIFNRPAFDMELKELSGSIQINNNLFGTVNQFTPVSFRSDENRKPGQVRFITNSPAPQSINNR